MPQITKRPPQGQASELTLPGGFLFQNFHQFYAQFARPGEEDATQLFFRDDKWFAVLGHVWHGEQPDQGCVEIVHQKAKMVIAAHFGAGILRGPFSARFAQIEHRVAHADFRARVAPQEAAGHEFTVETFGKKRNGRFKFLTKNMKMFHFHADLPE